METTVANVSNALHHQDFAGKYHDLVIEDGDDQPRASTQNALNSAVTCREAGIPFLSMTAYDGFG